jgi:hypothetical protein
VTKIASFLTLLITTLVCLLPAAPALAQRDRVFVASYGSDSNPCTFGSPCKTFQNAVNVVAQGGEVTAIDSAGFGTIIISHAVTITSPNGVEAGIAAPTSDNSAITINAGASDTVSLNGLTLDGDNVTGTVGIRFNSGGSLNIQNSVIRNFGVDGIYFGLTGSTASQLFVLNTLVSGNGVEGIYLVDAGSGGVVAVLDHVETEDNGTDGLFVSTFSQTVNVTVSNSVSANNAVGIVVGAASSGSANVMVQNSTIANNTAYGLAANFSEATIWVTRSTITGNADGWETNSSGTVTTFGDNNIVGNGSGNTAPPSTATYE